MLNCTDGGCSECPHQHRLKGHNSIQAKCPSFVQHIKNTVIHQSYIEMKTKGFSLNKQTFVDATALRYGWSTDGLQQHLIPT